MATRLPIQRVTRTQDVLPSTLKDIYRRINELQDKYPGGPKVGSTVVVATAAHLPTPRVGMRAYVRDTNTLHVVTGAVPTSTLPPLGVWSDTGALPPP